MPRTRIIRRLLPGATSAALLVGLLAVATPAAAADIVKPIVFPVDGTVTLHGHLRRAALGSHPRGPGPDGRQDDAPGRRRRRHGPPRGVQQQSTGGNSITIKGADGWTYHYIHVNNDTPGTDDGQATRAQAFPANIVVGARVAKGQVIAYMGDSGNAENAGAHLHFEIRQPAPARRLPGTPINPYESLQAATPADERGAEVVPPRPRRPAVRRPTRSASAPSPVTWRCSATGTPMALDEPVLYRAGTWHLRAGVTTAHDRADLHVRRRRGHPAVRRPRRRRQRRARAVPGRCLDRADRLRGHQHRGLDRQLRLRSATDRSWATGTATAPTTSACTAATSGTCATGGRPDRRHRRQLRLRTVHRATAGRGDWNGDGGDEPGIFRAGTWYPKVDRGHRRRIACRSFAYGTAGDQPLTGTGPTPSTGHRRLPARRLTARSAAEQVLGDVGDLDLVGAGVDLEDLGVPGELLDLELGHVAVAAVQLDGLHRHLGGRAS